MTALKTELTVFVASPGGLDEERQAVENIASTLSSTIGNLIDVTITVKRWEQIEGRAGAPQPQIDPWVEQCDVFIGVVHRRWGSPPDTEYDSGFAKEFDLAIKRWKSTGQPSISLFFKDVDSESLSDPGIQLQKVVDFRSSIEKNWSTFYNRYQSVSDFRAHIQRVLVEEMHRVGRIGATGQGYSPSRSGSARVSGESADTGDSGTGLRIVFDDFATAVAGGETGGSLDFDRLQLFALAVSRDNETIPVHLANRLYGRTKTISLARIEYDAWLAAYIKDVGRSRYSSERVIPFPSKFGGVAVIKKELLAKAAANMNSDDLNTRAGTLKLLRAFGVKPSALWPRVSLDDSASAEFAARWGAVRIDQEVTLAISCWLKVANRRDLRLAKILANSESSSTQDIGRALVGLLQATPDASALAEVAPELLSDPTVTARFADRTPIESLSSALLDLTASRSNLDLPTRVLALEELARRDEIPDSLIVQAINEKAYEGVFEDEWVRVSREIIFDRPMSTTFFTRIAGILGKLGNSDVIQQVLARAARNSPETQSIVDSTLIQSRKVDYLDPQAAMVKLLLDTNPEESQDLAIGLATDGYAPGAVYLDMLRTQGADQKTIDFVRSQYRVAGLRYLALHAKGSLLARTRKLIRENRSNDSLWKLESGYLLRLCYSAEDIKPLLENLRYGLSSDRKRQIGLYLTSATLTDLRELLSSEIDDVPSLALSELRRRDRAPSHRKLVELLGDSDADLRMVALDILCAGADQERLAEIEALARRRNSTTYYNVICELDHRGLSVIPELHPYVSR